MAERTQLLPTRRRTQIHRLSVKAVRGSDRGASALVEEGPLVIGTDEACGLVLGDRAISARHLELTVEGGGVVLRDLGSTNGVFVAGIRIREAVLEPGARITIGQTELVLEVEGKDDVELSDRERFGGLIGSSSIMRVVFAQLEAIAPSSACALIEGETGSGKELATEAIHRASPRADGPLIVFDCGAVAANLLEAELFGYEKGAFTGADSARAGLAEQADGGTLVMDEIGELPLELQPKLLRLIERKEVRRLGSTAAKEVDVRILASTHRNLKVEVKAGRFRQDLYYRLAALKVRLPALRERLADLPLLVDHLLAELGSKRRFDDLPEADRTLLSAHRWPGNVRELRNVVERLLAFPEAHRDQLLSGEAETDPEHGGRFLPLAQARERAQNAFERRYLRELMVRADGSITDAARLADTTRQFIQRLLRRQGMR